MAEEFKLGPKAKSLLNAVSRFFDGDVQVQFIGNLKSGYVKHDQAQIMQDGKNLFVQINDMTEPDFTATHELLHLLMTLRGFPQIYFPLTTGDGALDEQLQFVGTELFDVIAHFVVYSEQRKHGLITPQVEAEYIKGVRQTITPETGKVDAEMIIRVATILDAMVFFGNQFAEHDTVFVQNFPIATQAAQRLYKIITEKPTDSPFAFRRNVVKLFKAFDGQMKGWNLPELHLTDFAMLTSVFSKRQLGLKVSQVFKLYHSELKSKTSLTRAYIGFAAVDDQDSFVLTGPTDAKLAEKFIQNIYAKTVQELFDELKIPYLIR
ncbi:IpaB/EvcA family protein [Fructilactobacillus frigidiflavus]|uniref:IpaB/EvcA family protein n=1 Tax=Fructilactobacillus frigidiflavus TaxID=3242688 RepID=UPI00375777A8